MPTFLFFVLLFEAFLAAQSHISSISAGGTDLITLPWMTLGCDPGVDYCATMEFCVPEPNKYAFRLPGYSCLPGRGPTIRVAPGKTYQLLLHNTGNPSIARYATAIHTHGLHISPNGNSDNVTRYVEPGKCIKYTWAIPANHLGGTHWYYAVKHPDTQLQVHGGAFGMLIVEDQPDLYPAAPSPSEFEAWRTNELLLLASKLELEPSPYYFVDLYYGNGYEEAEFSISANVWYRLRVVGMEQGGRPGVIGFTGCDVHAVAIDGIWGLTVPLNSDPQLQFDMINRMDFALRCPPGAHNVSFFGGVVAHINAMDDGLTSQAHPFPNGPWAPMRPAYLEDLRDYSGPINSFTFYITDGYINNRSWPSSAHQPFLELNIGDVVEWTIQSSGSGPFHIQTYAMQVVSEDGTCGWHKKGQYYDVISSVEGDIGMDVAAHMMGAPPGPDCKVRFRIMDFGGRVMIRCQYLELSDGGSMGWVKVSGGPAPDFQNIAVMYCGNNGNCVPDGSCTPEYECGSAMGRDSCGGLCTLSHSQLPNCTGTRPYCSPINNRCSRRQHQKPLPGPIDMQKSPSSLVYLPWNSTGCEPTYDFCGDLEFCAVNNGNVEFAYRLPGEPCRPARCPVIRMTPGKKYQLSLHNRGVPGEANHLANLHTHGIHVRGDGNTDDITRHVHPGHTLKFTYDIFAGHQGGTFWYHAHVHEITKLQTAGGAFGMLILDDPPNFAPTPGFKLWLENELLLIASRVGDIYLGNGNKEEPLYMQVNVWYRLRIVGVDPEAKPKDLIVADSYCDVHRMQHDGVWNTVIPANVIPSNTWTMSGASRVEMAIRCNQSGIYNVRWFGGVVAKLIVQHNSPNAPPMGLLSRVDPWPAGYGQQWYLESQRPEYLRSLLTYQGPIQYYTYTIRHGFINDLPWNRDVPMAYFRHGDVMEWTFRGTAIHPFHLHIWHMQIVTPGGCGYHEEGQWYDVVSSAGGGDCTVRFKLHDHSGRLVLHCHYLEHEDMGTMTWLNVTGGPPPDLFQVEEFPTPRMYIPSKSLDVAIFSGTQMVGNANLAMSGRILAVTTMVKSTWVISDIYIYMGTAAVPLVLSNDPDLSKFQFKKTAMSMSRFTFSQSIATLGVVCPSATPKTLNIAVRVTVRSVGGTSTGVAWAIGDPISAGKVPTYFQFTPSCSAPTAPIFLRTGLLSANQLFTIQIDPSKLAQGQRFNSLPQYRLISALNSSAITPLGQSRLSEDGQGWLLDLSGPSGVFDIVLYGNNGAGKQVVYFERLTISGPNSLTLNGAECFATTNPQQLLETSELPMSISGIDLQPADKWWLVPEASNCDDTRSSNVTIRTSNREAVSLRGYSGVLFICYEHEGIVMKLPTCIQVVQERMEENNESTSSTTMIIIATATSVGAVVLSLCLSFLFYKQRHTISKDDELDTIFDPLFGASSVDPSDELRQAPPLTGAFGDHVHPSLTQSPSNSSFASLKYQRAAEQIQQSMGVVHGDLEAMGLSRLSPNSDSFAGH